MDPGQDISHAIGAFEARTLPASGRLVSPTANREEIDRAAREFEAVFISQFVNTLYSGLRTDGAFGGGQSEQIFRSLLNEEVSKAIAERGGFGLASHVARELIALQEARP